MHIVRAYTIIILALVANKAMATTCLYISSYHTGYAWSDGIERGLRKTLEGHCKVLSFYMDTKRNSDESAMQAAAEEAKQLIDRSKPDIVIAADDNASRFLVVPYFKDASLPIVFCGVNWSVEQYGYPFNNVTGMIEVAPINALLDKAKAINKNIKHAYYIGADSFTQKKNLDRFIEQSRKYNFTLTPLLSKTVEQWIESFKKAQSSDLIIMGSNAGIEQWDENTVLRMIEPYSKTLSVTNDEWMMPYTMFGITKIAEEQGEWSGKVAIEILNGAKPADIPIIPNKQYNMILNNTLLETANINVPEFIRLKSMPYSK